MRRDELIALRYGTPFKPFRLLLSDGAAYDVIYPELFHVLPDMAVVFEPTDDLGRNTFKDFRHVAFSDIVRVEPLQNAPTI